MKRRERIEKPKIDYDKLRRLQRVKDREEKRRAREEFKRQIKLARIRAKMSKNIPAYFLKNIEKAKNVINCRNQMNW